MPMRCIPCIEPILYPGYLGRIEVEPCKGETSAVPPLQGFLFLIVIPTQGAGRVAASALGFTVVCFQRSSK